jgi:hypothetical protein
VTVHALVRFCFRSQRVCLECLDSFVRKPPSTMVLQRFCWMCYKRQFQNLHEKLESTRIHYAGLCKPHGRQDRMCYKRQFQNTSGTLKERTLKVSEQSTKPNRTGKHQRTPHRQPKHKPSTRSQQQHKSQPTRTQGRRSHNAAGCVNVSLYGAIEGRFVNSTDMLQLLWMYA